MSAEKMLFVGGVLDGRWIEVGVGWRQYQAPKPGGEGFIAIETYERAMLEQYDGNPPVRHPAHFFRLSSMRDIEAVRRLMEFYRPEKTT